MTRGTRLILLLDGGAGAAPVASFTFAVPDTNGGIALDLEGLISGVLTDTSGSSSRTWYYRKGAGAWTAFPGDPTVTPLTFQGDLLAGAGTYGVKLVVNGGDEEIVDPCFYVYETVSDTIDTAGNGSFVFPAGVKLSRVELYGASGGGGGGYDGGGDGVPGAGSGGGGYSTGYVNVDGSTDYYVGDAGAGGTFGDPGATGDVGEQTWFKTSGTLFANPGAPGAGGGVAVGEGGAGGTAGGTSALESWTGGDGSSGGGGGGSAGPGAAGGNGSGSNGGVGTVPGQDGAEMGAAAGSPGGGAGGGDVGNDGGTGTVGTVIYHYPVMNP